MHAKNSIEMRFCVCVISFILAGATYAADFPSVEVTEQARVSGDATAGAYLFYSAQLGCARCHDAGDDPAKRIGPDLAVYPSDDRPRMWSWSKRS